MQEIFCSARVDDDAMCAAMRRSVAEFGYLPCPHTAVALGRLGWQHWPRSSEPQKVIPRPRGSIFGEAHKQKPCNWCWIWYITLQKTDEQTWKTYLAALMKFEMLGESLPLRATCVYMCPPHLDWLQCWKIGMMGLSWFIAATGAHFALPSDGPRIIFATASPCKFQSSVTTALGQEAWKNYEDTKSLNG